MSTTRGGRKRPQHNPAGGQGAERRAAARQRQAERENAPDRDVHVADGIRLQKVLAAAGYGSRRACEQLITDGRVEVDGVVVHELGLRVDPAAQTVHVDGMRVHVDDEKITIALNKPVGVVSSMSDPQGRPTIAEYVYNRGERLFHVGRLDTDSEGLILFTNDGELAHRLQHPSYEITKTYLVQVDGVVPRALGRTLLDGIDLEDGFAKVDSYRLVDATPVASMVEITIHEGRNRIVRRLFEAAGHPVVRLVRTSIGPIKLGTVRVGSTRVLSKAEVGALMEQVGL